MTFVLRKFVTVIKPTGIKKKNGFINAEYCRSLIAQKRNVHEYRKFQLSQPNRTVLGREENECLVKSGGILRYESNQLASNDPCEDRLLVSQVSDSDMYIFSVIDGHGGWQCAHAIKHRLPYYLALFLLDEKELATRNPVIRNDWVVPISGDLYHAWLNEHVFDMRTAESFMTRYQRRLLNQYPDTHPDTHFKHCFEALDEDISTEAVPEGQRITKESVNRLLAASAGACTATAVVHNGVLHVAGLGDCRAIIGNRGDDGKLHAKVLTEEHRTYNPVERERLIREHPCEDEDIMFFDERLCGILQPTRAFGDVVLKWSTREKVLLEYVFDEPTYVPNYISPPYLSCTPDVMSVPLDENCQFLIIATDGLWDGLSDEESVRLISHKPDGVNSATWLIQNSLAQHNEVRLGRILSIPPGPICRNVRDDISVIVIYFDM